MDCMWEGTEATNVQSWSLNQSRGKGTCGRKVGGSGAGWNLTGHLTQERGPGNLYF